MQATVSVKCDLSGGRWCLLIYVSANEMNMYERQGEVDIIGERLNNDL